MALAVTSLRLSLSTFSVGTAEVAEAVVEEAGILLLTQDGNFITTQSGNRIRLEDRAVGEEDRLLNFLLTQDGEFITTQSGDRIRLEARAFLHTQSNDRIITEADDAILLI